MKDKNLLTIIVLAVGVLFITQGGLTGQFHTDPYSDLRTVPIDAHRYAKGNVDYDPSGFVDVFDLEETRAIISLRQYRPQADMNDDGKVDWEDYGLLENFIAAHGSGQLDGRGGICTPGQTFCGRNTNSGTGTVQRCEVNAYGVPEFVTKPCDKGQRCLNGQCIFRQATRLH